MAKQVLRSPLETTPVLRARLAAPDGTLAHLQNGFCRASKSRRGRHPPNGDRRANNLDGALLQQHDEVAQLAEALRIMERMHSAPAFEVRDPLAVEHLSGPQHAIEPLPVEPMSRDGFVVRGCITAARARVPNDRDPSLVCVVSARSGHQNAIVRSTRTVRKTVVQRMYSRGFA